MTKMKLSKSTFFFAALFLVGAYIFFNFFLPNFVAFKGGSRFCQAHDEFKSLDFKGRLVKKYRDEYNHRYETLIISTEQGDIKTNILKLESSGIFDKLIEGDSLIKDSESQNLITIRNGARIQFTANFNCKNPPTSPRL